MSGLIVVRDGKEIGNAERQQVKALAAIAGDPSLADLSLEEFEKVTAERSRVSDLIMNAGARLEQEALRLSRDGVNKLRVVLRDDEKKHGSAIRDSMTRVGFRCTDIASRTFDSQFEMSWDLCDAVNHETGEVIKNVMRFGKHWLHWTDEVKS